MFDSKKRKWTVSFVLESKKKDSCLLYLNQSKCYHSSFSDFGFQLECCHRIRSIQWRQNRKKLYYWNQLIKPFKTCLAQDSLTTWSGSISWIKEMIARKESSWVVFFTKSSLKLNLPLAFKFTIIEQQAGPSEVKTDSHSVRNLIWIMPLCLIINIDKWIDFCYY